LKRVICKQPETLQNSFRSYFHLHGIKVEPWILNFFLSDINCIEDTDLPKDELIDLRAKNLLQLEFNSKSLEEFWCPLREAYPRVVKRSIEVFIPFETIYFCELGFSTLVTITIKN
jgi:hypothetical protein